MGAATARGDAVTPLRSAVLANGQTLAPDEAYATLRGMRTLNLRLERHQQNALAVAQRFAVRPEVSAVLHPALPGHPGAPIWQRDAGGSNGLLSVAFKEGFALESFLDRLRLFAIGSSWGGFESLAMTIDPAASRRLKYDLPAGPMARFHIGLEHVDDLIDDLDAAFDI